MKATAPAAEADREDQAAEVEEAAGDEDEDGAGEQRRVGAVAGEVLADRDLEAAERRRARCRAPIAVGLPPKTPITSSDDAGEDRQLGERELAPRRRRALVRRLGFLAQRPQAVRITGIRRRP